MLLQPYSFHLAAGHPQQPKLKQCHAETELWVSSNNLVMAIQWHPSSFSRCGSPVVLPGRPAGCGRHGETLCRHRLSLRLQHQERTGEVLQRPRGTHLHPGDARAGGYSTPPIIDAFTFVVTFIILGDLSVKKHRGHRK